MQEREPKAIRTVIHWGRWGADQAAQFSGAVATHLSGDPIAGIAIGQGVHVLCSTVDATMCDVVEWSLSETQKQKVGTGYRYAENRVWQHVLAGREPRKEFYQERLRDRPLAQEVLEGVLMKCRDEHQAKMLRHLGNIFGNAAFHPVEPDDVNRVLAIAERMSYRQLCIASLVHRREECGFDSVVWSTNRLRTLRRDGFEPSVEFHSFFRELHDLGPHSFGITSYVGDGFFDSGSETGELTLFGRLFFDLAGLEDIPIDELNRLADKFGAPGSDS